MKKNITIEEALDLFEQYALRYGYWAYEDVVHYKTANYYNDQVIKVIDYLKEQNALEALTPFYDHPSPYVRRRAAYFLLPVHEKRSLEVLKEIAMSSINPSLAIDAEYTIKWWKSGELKKYNTLSPTDLSKK